MGILECILSVLCDSVNAVLFSWTATRYFEHSHSVKDSFLLQAMTGFMGLICLWPFIILLDRIDQEPFELPNSREDAILIGIVMALDVIFYVSFCLAIVLTNPVLAACAS